MCWHALVVCVKTGIGECEESPGTLHFVAFFWIEDGHIDVGMQEQNKSKTSLPNQAVPFQMIEW